MKENEKIVNFFHEKISEIRRFRDWYLKIHAEEPELYDREFLEGSGYEEMKWEYENHCHKLNDK